MEIIRSALYNVYTELQFVLADNPSRCHFVQGLLNELQIHTSGAQSHIELRFYMDECRKEIQPSITMYLQHWDNGSRMIPDIYHEISHAVSLGSITKEGDTNYHALWGILPLQIYLEDDKVYCSYDHDLNDLNEILTNLAACYLYHLIETGDWNRAWKYNTLARKFDQLSQNAITEIAKAYIANRVSVISSIFQSYVGTDDFREIQERIRCE
ncbi:MAG: hypothetical protein ACI4MG_09630 [Aristaeellaceae bacterium]